MDQLILELQTKKPGQPSKQEIVDHINEIFKNAVLYNDYTHPMFNGSRVRGDQYAAADSPGIFWMDFTHEFKGLNLRPPELREQLFGHSVSPGVVQTSDTPQAKTMNLDTGVAAGIGTYMELTYAGTSATRHTFTRKTDGSWAESSWPDISG